MRMKKSECISCKNDIVENDSVIQIFSGGYVHEECILDYIFLNLEQFGLEAHNFNYFIKGEY